jgi:predicted nucleic acid-binding protein
MGVLELALLVDSVILIDHLAGLWQATEFINRNRYQISISVITRAEVLAGFDPAISPLPARLLDFFPTLGIDRDTADAAAALRRAHGLKLPDAFQAALALQHHLSLATRDTRHLSPDRFPFVTVPYVL